MLITNQKICMDDDSLKFRVIEFDQEAIQQYIKDNTLCIGDIKLFVLESTQRGLYAFYLSRSQTDAYRLHNERFRETGVKVTHADRLMTNLLTFTDTGKEESLYEY
ncbi:hypothetical protein [Sporosarcina ureae]|uniref:hypothetical protein n=1 Tax=Sporosarcina ureae TaxID=1571 RepID=UPI0009DC50D1|nr:hypothetical protein [Sporosarcina ureae]ARF16104.1 hypothetical protein SporoP17a_01555 [Sporosarcina ureae]